MAQLARALGVGVAAWLGAAGVAAAEPARVALDVRGDGSGCVTPERVAAQVALQLGYAPWDAAATDVITIDVVAGDAGRLPVATLRRGDGVRELTASSCSVLEANLIAALSVALAPPLTPPPATPAPAPAMTTPVAAAPGLVVSRPVEVAWRWPRPLTWALAGGGGALVAIGYALEAVANAKMETYATTIANECNGGCALDELPGGAGERPALVAAFEDRDSARTLGGVAVGVWAVGLAAATTGVIMAILNRPVVAEQATVVTRVSADHAGVALVGRF